MERWGWGGCKIGGAVVGKRRSGDRRSRSDNECSDFRFAKCRRWPRVCDSAGGVLAVFYLLRAFCDWAGENFLGRNFAEARNRETISIWAIVLCDSDGGVWYGSFCGYKGRGADCSEMDAVPYFLGLFRGDRADCRCAGHYSEDPRKAGGDTFRMYVSAFRGDDSHP